MLYKSVYCLLLYIYLMIISTGTSGKPKTMPITTDMRVNKSAVRRNT